MLSKVKTGLSLGIFFAALHLIWAICIALGFMQPLMDWVMAMHMLQNYFVILNFNIVYTILLIVITFISGFVFGWLFALFWNMFHKDK
jgi:hypothetical protein